LFGVKLHEDDEDNRNMSEH